MSSNYEASKALALLENIKSILHESGSLGPSARASVLAQISDLRDAIETPLDSVLRILAQPMQNVALRMAAELGLLSRLAADPNVTLGLDQIASGQSSHKCSSICGKDDLENGTDTPYSPDPSIADPELVGRFMRVLVAMGVCDEVQAESYKANKVTMALSQEGLSSGVKFRFDTEIPCANKLVDFFRSTKYRNPEDSAASPFKHAFGAPKFGWLQDNPETLANFNRWMTERREAGKQLTWLDFYPVGQNLINGAEVDDSAIFCVDVGGGKGHDLDRLRSRFPAIPGRLILQDSQIFSDHSTVFASMVHDFFQPQPLKGARVYHLRAILHDWPTAECKKILSHIVAAMKPNYSRLIIREFILPDTNAPLLGSCNDLLMMVLLAGMERTDSQWKRLLSDVGLEIVGFWTAVSGGEGVIEAVKKERIEQA
ncbi:hypothetical protein ACLMJK_002055 [Lecanora helva]